MEAIIDYKLKDFVKLKDAETIQRYVAILDLLQPLAVIDKPKFSWWRKGLKSIPVKHVNELLFGEVQLIRNYFSEGDIFECSKLLLGFDAKQLMELKITTFYGVYSKIRKDLEEIHWMEISELTDDYVDDFQAQVNASERMAKFGVLNVIDTLAQGDILKWEEVEKLPYMMVFHKLKMDFEKNKIQREITELQKKQLKK